MSDGKPNILGKLPVYNDAGEIFEAGADKVQFKHKTQRTGDYTRSGTQASDEAKNKSTKRTTRKTATKGSDSGVGARSRPSYERSGGKTESKSGKGSAKPSPSVPGKGKGKK
jgi:hypothetical protein